MVPTRNPDGTPCSIVVGFSGGQRVGPYHDGSGTNAGTCQGFLPVTFLQGNQIGYASHLRELSDDCRSSTGY